MPKWFSRLFKHPPTAAERAANILELMERTLRDYLVHCPTGSNVPITNEELADASSSHYVTEATLAVPSLYVSRLAAARPQPVSEHITRLATTLPLSRFSHWRRATDLIAQVFAIDLVVTVPLIIDLALKPTHGVNPLSASVVSDAAAFFAWLLMDIEYAQARNKDAAVDELRMLTAMGLWLYRPGPRALSFIEQFKAFRASNLPITPDSPTEVTTFLFGVDDLLEALVTGQPVPAMSLLQRTLTERAVLYSKQPQDLCIRMETRLRGLIIASQSFHEGAPIIRDDVRKT